MNASATISLLKLCASPPQLVCFDYLVPKFEEDFHSKLPMPLKVGFLLEGMSGNPSGAWTRFEAIVRALSSAGVEVYVRGVEGHHDSLYDLPLKSFELSPKPGPVKRFLRRGREIEAFARRTGVQIVHLEAPPFVGGKTVPTVASVHDLRHFYKVSRSLRSGEALYQLTALRFHLMRIDLIYALRQWSADEIQRIFGISSRKILVVPPIVEKKFLAPAKRSSPRRKVRYVMALGHLERRKNLEVIIAASAEKTWPQDLELLVVGRDQGSLEKIAELNCLTGGKAVFIGSVSDKEKWELLHGAIAVLLPSTVEGFGIVAAEAPIAESPVLVASSSSLEAMAGHPSALVDPDSPADWARAVNEIARNAKLREKITRIQQAQAKSFSAPLIVKMLLDSYRVLIQRYHQDKE